MNIQNEVRIVMQSRSINEGFARSAASSFSAQLDPTLEQLNDIKTAVSEAVTNCIVHAYPDTVGQIIMTMRIYTEGYIEFTIKDKGRGIPDVKTAMTPLYTTGGEDRSGMGFTIMDEFMDKLYVRSSPGKGTTVRLRKKIAGRT